MLSAADSKKQDVMPVAPIDTIFGDKDAAREAAMAVSFKELLDRELGSMLDVVFGALKQSAADPMKRKKSVLGAVDAFRSFLTVGLDVIGKAAAKTERPLITTEANQGGFTMSELFKTKEEFTEAVSTIVGEVFKVRDEADTAAQKEAADKATKEADEKKLNEAKTTVAVAEKGEKDATAEAKLNKVVGSMGKLATTVADLVKKQEEFGDQLATDSGAAGDEGDTAEKDDKGNLKHKKKQSVFAGLLTTIPE